MDIAKPVAPDEELITERLVLRQITGEDAAGIVAVCSTPDVAYFTTVPSPYRIEDAHRFINEMVERGRHWGVHLTDGTYIGTVGFTQADSTSMEIGFVLHEAFRGHGYMREAARAAVEDLWDAAPAVRRLLWRANLDNPSSWLVVQPLGFQLEGTERGCVRPSGAVVDQLRASLLRDEPMRPVDSRLAAWRVAAQLWPTEPAASRPYDSRRPQELVKQFHRVYGLPVCDSTCPSCDRERIHMRMSLVSEEYAELVGAIYGQPARELIEAAQREAVAADDSTRDTVEAADALADLVYVIYGMALECGIDLEAVLHEVQASNLSKLGADGMPIYREDGKVLKGPGFFPPDVAGVLCGSEPRRPVLPRLYDLEVVTGEGGSEQSVQDGADVR